MNIKKLAALGAVSFASVLAFTGVQQSDTAKAAASFPTYTGIAHSDLDPMGSVTYTSNKGYNIADGASGVGYYSGGTKYLGPRNGMSAAAAISTIQVKVSNTKNGPVYTVKTIKTNGTSRTQPGVGPRLDAVPNFSFGNLNAKKLMTRSANLSAKSYKIQKGYSAGKTSFDGNSKGYIKVAAKRTDLNKGYRLFAAVSPLKATNGRSLSKIRLTLDARGAQGANGKMAKLYSSTGAAKTILVGKPGVTGEASVKLTSKNVHLLIAKNKHVKAGTYQANVVWTLANNYTAQGKAANASAQRTPSDLS